MTHNETEKDGTATEVAVQARRILAAGLALARYGDVAIPEPGEVAEGVAARLREGVDGLTVFDLDALPG